MGESLHRGRIIQDGMVVASAAAADREAMLRHIDHYAAVYSEDGAIRIEVRSGKGRWRRLVP